ncbi:hypothetical protein D9M70_579480 [compost metagenome]
MVAAIVTSFLATSAVPASEMTLLPTTVMFWPSTPTVRPLKVLDIAVVSSTLSRVVRVDEPRSPLDLCFLPSLQLLLLSPARMLTSRWAVANKAPSSLVTLAAMAVRSRPACSRTSPAVSMVVPTSRT